MLVDTVGFIHRLPHMLIDAFKATLEEVRTATLLLHVVDASSRLRRERMTIVDRSARGDRRGRDAANYRDEQEPTWPSRRRESKLAPSMTRSRSRR